MQLHAAKRLDLAPRKFMDEVRFAMRSAGLSYRTEQSYYAVIRRFIQFHGRRHPAELGATEVALYLTALAAYTTCLLH
jgi:hypothetical protein